MRQISNKLIDRLTIHPEVSPIRRSICTSQFLEMPSSWGISPAGPSDQLFTIQTIEVQVYQIGTASQVVNISISPISNHSIDHITEAGGKGGLNCSIIAYSCSGVHVTRSTDLRSDAVAYGIYFSEHEDIPYIPGFRRDQAGVYRLGNSQNLQSISIGRLSIE